MRIVFQIGTNQWQGRGTDGKIEFAPGSGVAHESHHRALQSLDGTAPYSIWPSRMQRFRADADDVRVFELEHDIPICESVSPVSSYRWHAMPAEEFEAYRARLRSDCEAYIDDIERRHGEPVTLAIVHHTFLNPIVMGDINRARVAAGRPRIPVLCFVHGTALKMFIHEKRGDNQEEFPMRFLALQEREGTFSSGERRAVDWCAAISREQLERFRSVFPDYPRDRVMLSPNGYNQSVFRPAAEPAAAREWRRAVLPGFSTAPYEGSAHAPRAVPGDYDAVVAFCGKFADWKRLDALLHAAAVWEADEAAPRTCLLVVGSGPHDRQVLYQDLADELGLRHAYFLGPKEQPDLARLFTAADVAVFPSRDEPFGLVFIEAMACGTPVIGAASGGPLDFVTAGEGALVPEQDDVRALGASLADAVGTALRDDWKTGKGPHCAEHARANFSVATQIDQLLERLIQPAE